MHVATGPGADFATLRFSTDDAPERERVTMMREVYGRAVARVDFEPLDDRVRIEAVLRTMPGLNMWIGSFSRVRGYRDRTLIANGNDDVQFSMDREGGTVITHLGRELTKRAG